MYYILYAYIYIIYTYIGVLFSIELIIKTMK